MCECAATLYLYGDLVAKDESWRAWDRLRAKAKQGRLLLYYCLYPDGEPVTYYWHGTKNKPRGQRLRVFKTAKAAMNYLRCDEWHLADLQKHKRGTLTRQRGYVERYPPYPVHWMKAVPFIPKRISIRARRAERAWEEAFTRDMERRRNTEARAKEHVRHKAEAGDYAMAPTVSVDPGGESNTHVVRGIVRPDGSIDLGGEVVDLSDGENFTINLTLAAPHD